MVSKKTIVALSIISGVFLLVWLVGSFLGFALADYGLFVCILFLLSVLLFMGLGLFLIIRANLSGNSLSADRKRVNRLGGCALFLVGALVSFYFLNHFIKVMVKYKADGQV